MFSEIGLHFMFLGQMIYGCIQQSGMNTRKQIYVLHKNLSLPCNNIHSTHTHTHKHTPTHKQGQLNMREMFWILACWNLLYNL